MVQSNNEIFSAKSPEVTWGKRAANQEFVSPGDSDQWLRKVSLTISGNDSNEVLDFTPQDDQQLRVTFRVNKMTNESPNLLEAKIYNLAPKTIEKAVEFRKVTLSAGYKTGRYGEIFVGTIVQFRRGKETPVDTYLEIFAGDGDLAYGHAVTFKQWAEGTANKKYIEDVAKSITADDPALGIGTIDSGPYGDEKLTRHLVVARQANRLMREYGNASNSDWYIDDGKIHVLNRTKYQKGETAVLTPSTGLIGMPEVTPIGIQIRCLLNPNLRLGGLVQVKTDVLSGTPFMPGSRAQFDKEGNPVGQTTSPDEAPGGLTFYPASSQFLSAAFTSPIGVYKILLLDHSGDTRGNAWYSDMVCVALNKSGQIIFSKQLPYQRSIAIQDEKTGGNVSPDTVGP